MNITGSAGLLFPELLRTPRTRTITVRSPWWKRPWRTLRGKKTHWVVQWNEPPILPIRNPVRDALPSFKAFRGVR